MPEIDERLVTYLCKLSRLELSEDEVPRYVSHLKQIVDYVELLKKVPTDGVEPTSHVLDVKNVMRPDVPAASEPREKILSNAPCRTEDSFKVPKVV